MAIPLLSRKNLSMLRERLSGPRERSPRLALPRSDCLLRRCFHPDSVAFSASGCPRRSIAPFDAIKRAFGPSVQTGAEHDYPAAESYLCLTYREREAEKLVRALTSGLSSGRSSKCSPGGRNPVASVSQWITLFGWLSHALRQDRVRNQQGV